MRKFNNRHTYTPLDSFSGQKCFNSIRRVVVVSVRVGGGYCARLRSSHCSFQLTKFCGLRHKFYACVSACVSLIYRRVQICEFSLFSNLVQKNSAKGWTKKRVNAPFILMISHFFVCEIVFYTLF